MSSDEPVQKKCAHCGKEFETTNKRRKYCCDKCNNAAYIKRRYERDKEFNKRMRNCWREYGMDECPICGKQKRRTLSVCDACKKVSDNLEWSVDIDAMANDPESLFNNVDSLLRMEILMAVMSHKEYTEDELLLIFRGQAEDDKLRALIKSVLEEEQ